MLMQRQVDGCLEPFPIWDDVCTFDGRPWRGAIDIVSGGFPCQDISSAGNGKGIEHGERSGLWREYKRIINEVQPTFVFAENSPLLRRRGLNIVLRDLDELGYDAQWCVLGAWHLGCTQKRDRMWVLAYSNKGRCNSDKIQSRTCFEIDFRKLKTPYINVDASKAWLMEHAYISRKPNDLAEWMDRLAAIGNGQVPVVAAAAFQILSAGIIDN